MVEVIGNGGWVDTDSRRLRWSAANAQMAQFVIGNTENDLELYISGHIYDLFHFIYNEAAKSGSIKNNRRVLPVGPPVRWQMRSHMPREKLPHCPSSA